MASPAMSPSARISSGCIRIDNPPEPDCFARRLRGGAGGRRADLLVRSGQALDAFVDLLWRDARVCESQARLAAVEHEVRALDELNATLGGSIEQSIHVRASRQLDPHEVATLRIDEAGVWELAAQRLRERPGALTQRRLDRLDRAFERARPAELI